MASCLVCGKRLGTLAVSCPSCGVQAGQALATPAGAYDIVERTWFATWLGFSGRLSRRSFWLYHALPAAALELAALFIDAKVNANGTLFVLVVFLMLWPGFSANVQRAHDRGRSGWFLLLLFIPLVSIWPSIELGFMAGDIGPNQYGPDPLAPPSLGISGR